MTDSFSQLLRMGRFQFLAAGFLLFTMGVLFAHEGGASIHIDRFLCSYAILGVGHLSVSYSNEYFDRFSDCNGESCFFSGGSGVLRERPELAETAKKIALFLIGTSILASIPFVHIFAVPRTFIVLVILGNILGWFYSAPPFRFSYRGLGEITTAIAVGFLLPGIGYLSTKGEIDIPFLIFALPLFLYGFFFIISVEMPDMEADRQGQKWTFIARNGRKTGWKILFLFSVSAVCMYLGLVLLFPTLNADVFILASLLPLLAGYWGFVSRCERRDCAVIRAGANLLALILFCVWVDLYLLILFVF